MYMQKPRQILSLRATERRNGKQQTWTAIMQITIHFNVDYDRKWLPQKKSDLWITMQLILSTSVYSE